MSLKSDQIEVGGSVVYHASLLNVSSYLNTSSYRIRLFNGNGVISQHGVKTSGRNIKYSDLFMKQKLMQLRFFMFLYCFSLIMFYINKQSIYLNILWLCD